MVAPQLKNTQTQKITKQATKISISNQPKRTANLIQKLMREPASINGATRLPIKTSSSYVIEKKVSKLTQYNKNNGPDIKESFSKEILKKEITYTSGVQAQAIPLTKSTSLSISKNKNSSSFSAPASSLYSEPSVASANPHPTISEVGPTTSYKNSPIPSAPATLSCSSSLGTGSFNSPQTLSISCTSQASVKYCLSLNGCCDPEAGLTYTSSIHLGEGAGTYCLSFVGKNPTTLQNSTVIKVQYTFNPYLPHLQFVQEKIQVQTTELASKVSLTSQDFGRNYFSAGIINLKNHDPGVMGLNWSCEDIVSNHSSLTSPLSLPLLPETDLVGYDPSSQLELLLDGNKLDYGPNFIASFIKNNEYNTPYYTCSTNKVVLEDFTYFQEFPSHHSAEFSGSFTPIGFFEPADSVYRGPAGFSSEQIASQELEVGLFGIFF